MRGSSWSSRLRPQARGGNRRQVGKAPSSADGSIVARRPGHDNSIGVDVRPRIPRARRDSRRARAPGAAPACQARGSCDCCAPSGGCSSAVERHVANVNVGGSNPLTRFSLVAPIARSGFFMGSTRLHPGGGRTKKAGRTQRGADLRKGSGAIRTDRIQIRFALNRAAADEPPGPPVRAAKGRRGRGSAR
jgi:hypothetical protein